MQINVLKKTFYMEVQCELCDDDANWFGLVAEICETDALIALPDQFLTIFSKFKEVRHLLTKF